MLSADPRGGFLGLTADALQISLPMFARIASVLSTQLRLRQPLLKLMQILVELRHTSPHRLQRSLLAVLFGNPLSQLSLPGPRVLLQATDFE